MTANWRSKDTRDKIVTNWSGERIEHSKTAYINSKVLLTSTKALYTRFSCVWLKHCSLSADSQSSIHLISKSYSFLSVSAAATYITQNYYQCGQNMIHSEHQTATGGLGQAGAGEDDHEWQSLDLWDGSASREQKTVDWMYSYPLQVGIFVLFWTWT